MSDSEWDDVLHQIDEMMGGGTAGESKTYQAFIECYNEDMTIVGLAEGTSLAANTWGISNGDELRTWINNAKDDATAAATAFGDLWRGKVRPDLVQINKLSAMSEAWTDDVHEPIRNESGFTRESGLLQTWYGPGAQKYQAAVMVQASAMDEMNGLVQQAGSGLKATSNLVKNIALLMLHSLQPVHDKLSGWPKHGWGEEHDSDMIFGERTGYAKSAFEGLRDWLGELVEGGDWKNQTDTIRTTFEDLKVKTTSFKANTWPQAVTDGIGDMRNGNSGLGDQTQQGQPPAQQPPPAGSTEPDPDSGGTTTVNDDGGVESQGGGSTPGDNQYEGNDYTGLDSDGDEGTHGAGTHYSNIDN